MPDELHRVEFRGELQGQYRENVMYWRITGATDDTPFGNSNALVAFLDTNIKPLYLAAAPVDYYLEAITARRVGPTSGQYATIDYAPFTATGLRGPGSASEQLCPCVTLIPPMGVKSAGRIFLPAVSKIDINLNVPIAGYITAVNNLINAMVVGGSVAGGLATLAIYSRKHNTSSAVAAFHLSPVIGYQRRRSHPVGV